MFKFNKITFLIILLFLFILFGSSNVFALTFTDNTSNNTGTYTVNDPDNTDALSLLDTCPYVVQKYNDELRFFISKDNNHYLCLGQYGVSFNGITNVGGITNFAFFTYNLTNSTWTYNFNRTGNGQVGLDAFVYFNADIYTDVNKTDYFFQLPLVATLVPIVEEVETNRVMSQIILILPTILVILVSFLGLRKALQMLFQLLHKA